MKTHPKFIQSIVTTRLTDGGGIFDTYARVDVAETGLVNIRIRKVQGNPGFEWCVLSIHKRVEEWREVDAVIRYREERPDEEIICFRWKA